MNENSFSKEQKMNLGVLIRIFYKYRYSILLIVLFTTSVSTVMAYFKPISYTASVTMEVAEEKSHREDTMSTALDGSGSNFANETEVITSRYLIEKALDQLDLGRRYYTVESFRTIELYKNSPFIVEVIRFDRKLYNEKIFITPINKKMFRLEIKKDTFFTKESLKDVLGIDEREDIVYVEEFEYGKEISSPWFTIKIEKIVELKDREYSFSVIPNKAMYNHIVGKLRTRLINRQGSILEISYRDNVALRAKEVVDVISKVYMQDQIEKKRGGAEKILKFINDELEGLNVDLSESANKLKQYKQVNRITDLESSAASIKTKISMNESTLAQMLLEEDVLSSVQEFIKSGNDLSSISINETQLSNSNLVEKMKKYQELSAQRREYLSSYTEFHPDVIKLKNELELVKKSIKFTIETSLKTLQKRKAWYKNENDKLLSSLEVLPHQERKLSTLTRNFSVNEKIYSYLLEQRSVTAILQASTISKTRILDSATVPGADPAKRMFMVLVGILLGGFFGLLQAYVRNIINDTVKDKEEIEILTNLPFFGLIPSHVNNKYTLAYSEAFRILRSNLEFIKIDKSCKVILLASAISGEGKSTTIKNLAETLVKLNRKVIVLDYDLRRPSLNKLFNNIKNRVGLSTLLSAQSRLEDSIQITFDNIHIITAGPIPPNPSELIMSQSTDLLLETLSQAYDYILIDSPPYSIVTDASILMRRADITLFSIMVEHTKRENVSNINDIIEKYNIKTAGIVCHNIKLKREERHGYGYFKEE